MTNDNPQARTAPSQDDRLRARKKALNYFAAAEQRDTLVKEITNSERTATEAKTNKLRALRLAKEEADREIAANAPPPPKRARKAR